jgi:hypothetical protein
MRELRERLHVLDDVEAPDVWPFAERTAPGSLAPVEMTRQFPGRRVVAGTVALLISIAAAIVLLHAFRPSVTPAHAPDNVFLPRLTEHQDAWPAALIWGTLVESDGCVFIASDYPGTPSERVLLIWPLETTAESPDGGALRILVDGQLVGQIGDRVRLGGGFVGESKNDVGFAESLTGTAIPEACRTDGGYWITPGT